MTTVGSQLWRHFLRALAPLLVVPAVFACFVGGEELGRTVLGPPQAIGAAPGAVVMAGRPVVAGSPAALVDRHDCWSSADDQPEDAPVPRHVVVTRHGQARYAGSRLTELALEQVASGRDRGLVVHAFCR